MSKTLVKILISIFLFFATGCGKPITYYTNPNSAGYQKQELAGICERCGKMFHFSGDQLDHLTNIECPYCNYSQNLREASKRWAIIKKQYEQQQVADILGAAITGFASGYTDNKGTSNNSSSTYKSSGCSSDYECGIGNRCVKAQYSSTGTCMKTVNQYGTPTYDLPDPNNIGINPYKKCSFDTDCPIGFKCDSSYNACVKL
jgi:DNA-directed RNA polymerase subunit RPC12/RpoP